MAARGTNGLAKLLWNRTAASSQGVITVQVLRTAADAKSFPAPILKLNPVRPLLPCSGTGDALGRPSASA